MTQQEFIERHRHKFAGMALDGAVAERKGAELGLWARQIMRFVDEELALCYRDLNPPPPPPPPATGSGPPQAGKPPGKP